MSNGEDHKRKYRIQQFYYLLIKVPFSLIPGIFGLVYVYFFWDFLAMDPTYFVIGMVIYGIANALNDPLIGQWSDRVDINRWGSRRLIFIKYGGPIWGLFFFLLWFPWSYSNPVIIFFHFIVMLILFDTMLTMVILVWDALLPEIAESIPERNRIFFLAGVVGALGGIPILFSLELMKGSLVTFQIYAGIFAVVSAIIFFIAASKLRERPELHQKMNPIGLVDSFKQCLRSKSFISFTMYRFFDVVNFTMLFSFIFVYVLLFGQGMDTILIVVVGLGGIIGQWIYLKLSEKKEMQYLIMRGRAIAIIIAVVAFPISLIGGTLFIWGGLLLVRIILGGCTVFINPYLLLIADEDEMNYDTRREGMFLGTNAVFNKIAESIGPIIATSVLLIFGYVQNAPDGFIQPDSAIIGIKFLLFIVPAIMDGLGILALKFYPIKGEKLKELTNYIEDTHQEKLREYEKNQEL